MKHTLLLLALAALITQPLRAVPQDSTFTYQGQLKHNGLPATGSYDINARLWDAETGGTFINQSNVFAHPVSNGLFQMPVSFGADAFNGQTRWIEISVRPVGTAAYTTLTPRQQVTTTPYATRALTADTVTSVPSTALPGNVARTDGPQTFTGPVTFSQPISGSGSGLTGVPGSVLTRPTAIVQWGRLFYVQPVAASADSVVAAACADNRSLGVLADGTVKGWGGQSLGGISNDPVGFTAVSSGAEFAVGLRKDGTLAAWGYANYGELYPPALPAGMTYTAVSAGTFHGAALRSDGAVVAWGYNERGQTNTGGTTGYTAVACGHRYTAALRTDGSVQIWGLLSSPGALPAPAVKIAGGFEHAMVLLNDGRIVSWDGAPVPASLSVARPANDPLRPVQIAANYTSDCALLANGTIVAWGSSGDGGSPPPGNYDFKYIAGGCAAFHFIALRNSPSGEAGRGTAALVDAANNFQDPNTFAAITTFNGRVTVTDTTGDHDFRVTDGTDNGNIHLQTLRGGNSGYSALNFNGYWDTDHFKFYRPTKIGWRMIVDQRGGSDHLIMDLLKPTGGSIAWGVNSAGGFGIGGLADPAYKLDVQGNARVVSLTQTSDRRYKQDIQPLTGALDKVSRLQGVSYDWKRAAFPDKNFSDRRQIGFIAQDVRKVLPELVTEDSQGYLSVAYTSAVPVLVEAVKELRAENAELKARLERIEELLTHPVAKVPVAGRSESGTKSHPGPPEFHKNRTQSVHPQ